MLLMPDTPTQISELLHEAAETHHRVYAITEGDDPDWATWYSDWLVNLSQLPQLLGVKPVRSELTYVLVMLDKQYVREAPAERWEDYYSRALVNHFAPRI
jgi:hypothetical protein